MSRPLLTPKSAAVLVTGCAAAWTCAIFSPLLTGVLSSSWPKANATLIDSRYVGESRKLAVSIAYEFSVAGVKYTGTNYDSFGVYRGWLREKVLARYPVGAKTLVSFSPRDPARALLVGGLGVRHFTLLGSGLFLWCVAIILWRATSFRKSKKKK